MMRICTGMMAVLLAALMSAAPARAAVESNYVWTISGSLSGEADSNEILVGVTSDSGLPAATLELYYDTTLVEHIKYEADTTYLTGRVTGMSAIPDTNSTDGRVRVVLFDFDENIPPGSGDILKFLFRVKDGVTGGTMAPFTLTTKTSRDLRDTLVVENIEVEGSIWDTPGDPAQASWGMKGLAVADSNATEVNVVMTNTLWIANMVLKLTFDPQVLELTNPSTDITLKGRAADLNLDVAYEQGSGVATLTISTTSETPPFPVVDPGGGTVLGVKFAMPNGMDAGSSTQLDLELDGGTALASYQLAARAFSGPTSDVDGNGATTIFDALEFLSIWKNAPPNPFTDVNGDGVSNIFDLLDILADL